MHQRQCAGFELGKLAQRGAHIGIKRGIMGDILAGDCRAYDFTFGRRGALAVLCEKIAAEQRSS